MERRLLESAHISFGGHVPTNPDPRIQPAPRVDGSLRPRRIVSGQPPVVEAQDNNTKLDEETPESQQAWQDWWTGFRDGIDNGAPPERVTHRDLQVKPASSINDDEWVPHYQRDNAAQPQSTPVTSPQGTIWQHPSAPVSPQTERQPYNAADHDGSATQIGTGKVYEIVHAKPSQPSTSRQRPRRRNILRDQVLRQRVFSM